MWDLPRPGIEPVSPALAGGFSSTAPWGKSLLCFLDLFSGCFPFPLFKFLFQLKQKSVFSVSDLSIVHFCCYLLTCFLVSYTCSSCLALRLKVSFVVNSLVLPELLYKNKFSKVILMDILEVSFYSLHCLCFIQMSFTSLFRLGSFLFEAFHECLVIFGNSLIHSTKSIKKLIERVCVGAAFVTQWASL